MTFVSGAECFHHKWCELIAVVRAEGVVFASFLLGSIIGGMKGFLSGTGDKFHLATIDDGNVEDGVVIVDIFSKDISTLLRVEG